MSTNATRTDAADAEEAERLALERAVAEARSGGPAVPHAEVRRELLDIAARARARIEAMRPGRDDAGPAGA